MKKILTFLVMLVACVSILSAQDTQIPQAKFNYQAVVRDRNNDNNLVMEKPVTVTVQILVNNDISYTKDTTVTTNRNGMVSFIIGPVTNVTDWTNATVKATFKDGDKILSEVMNPVMPVPLALQAAVDPMEITTDKIVEYLSSTNTTGQDVKRIIDALTGNSSVKNAVRDSIISYIKTQPDKVKELAIYFLGTVTPADVDAAIDTLSDDVKTKIKDLAVAYLESSKGKEVIYDVLEYYLTNTSKADVQALWAAARANENFHEIFNAVRDSVIDYIKGHKDLVKSVAMYYMTVIDVEDVQDLHAYLKQNNNGVYTYMINKLGDYLNSYLTNEYKAVKECDGKDICDLQGEIDQLKQDALKCPKVTEASINGKVFTATVANVGDNFSATAANTYLLIYKDDQTEYYLPQTGRTWNAVSTVANTFSITDAENATPGDYYFTLDLGDNKPQGCAASVVKVTVGTTTSGN